MDNIPNENNTFKNKSEEISVNKGRKKIRLTNYYFLYSFFMLVFLTTKIIDKYELHPKTLSLEPFIKFIKDCKKLRRYHRPKIFNEHPYISVCIPAMNMEDYIERTLLTIINQSFQDFEIIVINDYSIDETENILKRLKKEDDRIKYVNHPKNLGVYASRTEAILMAKGKYIILMDPDDMFLNEDLFQELYNYNQKYQLDIIEFEVYQQKEGESTIYLPQNNYEAHYHNFSKKIISQPELSELLFYDPVTHDYTKTICRNIWNKMIRKEPLEKMIKYIGYEYYHDYVVITSDDMIMNILTYHYASNYTNIELPGYLYNIRQKSMSRGEVGLEMKKLRTINYYLYFTTLYRYLKEFKKDRNFLYYELRDLGHFMVYIKECNLKDYIKKAIKFFKQIIKDKHSSKEFKAYSKEFINFYKKKEGV